MSLWDVLEKTGELVNTAYTARMQNEELRVRRREAEASAIREQAVLESVRNSQSGVMRFAKYAFYVAMGFAAVAVFSQFRRMWKGA